MVTAVKQSVGLYAMAENPTTAMAARRSKGMDRAFEAIKHVQLAVH